MEDQREPGDGLIGEVDVAEDDVIGDADLLSEMLWWIDFVTCNGAGWEDVLPTDFDHARDHTGDEAVPDDLPGFHAF